MRALLFVVSFLCVFVPRSLRAENFEELRSRYITLRNTDIDIKQRSEWLSLAAALEKFADGARAGNDAPPALFYSGVLRGEMSRRFSTEEPFNDAERVFSKLVERFPKSDLADDALLHIAELELSSRWGSEREAKKALERVNQEYAATESQPVAQERLRELEGAGSKGKAKRSKADAPVDREWSSNGSASGHVVVIDPGHGGDDRGAVGVGGLFEKDVVLDIALKLEAFLVKEGVLVRLTRRSDEFVPLEARTRFANDYQADLFISLHTNASPEKKLAGLQTYYLDNTDEQGSRKLADRENAAGQVGVLDDDLRFIVSDLIQSAKLDDSIRLAHTIQGRLLGDLRKPFGEFVDAGVRKGPFYVLVGAHMPCVLVELFFIDNALDGRRLADSRFRSAVASSLARGIIEFLGTEGT